MSGEYKVTLSIYSGRPDPSWTIHSSHESYKKIKEHKDERARDGKAPSHPRQMAAKLGYRGFLLHHQDAEHPELIVGQETVAHQQLLLDTMPKELKRDDFHHKISRMIACSVAPEAAGAGAGAGAGAPPPGPLHPSPPGPRDVTSGSPVLDLAKWNSDDSVKLHNNCYNYANDQITGTFARPGNASGHPCTVFRGQQVQRAAVYDGLQVLVPQPGPNQPPVDAPDGRWLVALVVAPDVDFHWYRLDSNRLWSHKPGGTAATRYDGNDELITDPRNAANSGTDYEFHSFMTTNYEVNIQ